MIRALVVTAVLGFTEGSSPSGSASGAGGQVDLAPQELTDDPTPAEREWEELLGRITPKLVEFQSLPREDRAQIGFQGELAELGTFFRKYRESEPDFAWSARIFMANEILAKVMERPGEAVQVLREVTRKAPSGLLAGVAAISAGRFLVLVGDEAGLRQLRDLYAARDDGEPGFLEALEDLVIQAALRPGQPFPDLGIRDLAGATIRIEQLRGKVVLVLVFNVEHDASREELRRAVALDARLRDKGLAVVGISLDEERELLEKALEEDEVAFPVGFDGLAWESPAARMLGINRLPTAFIFGPEGVIRHSHVRGVEVAPLVEATLERVQVEARRKDEQDKKDEGKDDGG